MTKNKKVYATIQDHLDQVLAYIGILFGLIVIWLSIDFHLNREYLGAAALTASIIYLLCKKAFTIKSNIENRGWQISKKLFIVGTTLFSICLFASVYILRTNSFYNRNLWYFMFFLIAAFVTFLQIIFLDYHSKWQVRIVLLQIFFASISLKAGAFFLYPSLSGNDPFYHQMLIETFIQTGAIPSDSTYHHFPLFHMLIATFSLVSQTDTKSAFFFLSVLQSIALLLVYPIGKKFFNHHTGLLAALFLEISDFEIIWGIQIIPMAFGVILFALMVFGLFLRTSQIFSRSSWSAIILLCAFAVILTHTLSTLIIISAIGILIVFSKIFKFMKTAKQQPDIASVTLLLIVTVSAIYYWGTASSGLETDFFSRVISNIVTSIDEVRIGEVEMVSFAEKLNKLDVILGDAGLAVLLFLFLIGFFGSLQVDNRKKINLSILVLGLGLLLITYGSAVIGARHILPDRWLSFSYILLSLPAGYAVAKLLFYYSIRIQHERVWFPIIPFSFFVIVAFLYLFFMVTSPNRSAPDSPIYTTRIKARPGFYQSEVVGLQYAERAFDGEIAASSKTGRLITISLPLNPEERKTYENQKAIVIRRAEMIDGFFIPFTNYQVSDIVFPTNEFLQDLQENYIKNYDNGEVELYVKNKFTSGGDRK